MYMPIVLYCSNYKSRLRRTLLQYLPRKNMTRKSILVLSVSMLHPPPFPPIKSESPHKNRACYGWRSCNGICLVSGTDVCKRKPDMQRFILSSLDWLGVYVEIRIIFETVCVLFVVNVEGTLLGVVLLLHIIGKKSWRISAVHCTAQYSAVQCFSYTFV